MNRTLVNFWDVHFSAELPATVVWASVWLVESASEKRPVLKCCFPSAIRSCGVVQDD